VSLALLGLLGARTGGAEVFKPIRACHFFGRTRDGADGWDRGHRWHRCLTKPISSFVGSVADSSSSSAAESSAIARNA
jgi:hypothetical protein